VIVSVHSFTPTYHGIARPWHVGILYTLSERFAQTIQHFLGRDESLTIGVNVPYTVTPDTDYGLLVYADARGNQGVEFEIRQDLIVGVEQQHLWANRLAAALQHSIQLFG
jgi:predicted N-formylglutamate amidohydrolase